jgi:hypothetical protein
MKLGSVLTSLRDWEPWGALSQGCAALHPGLTSCVPSGNSTAATNIRCDSRQPIFRAVGHGVEPAPGTIKMVTRRTSVGMTGPCRSIFSQQSGMRRCSMRNDENGLGSYVPPGLGVVGCTIPGLPLRFAQGSPWAIFLRSLRELYGSNKQALRLATAYFFMAVVHEVDPAPGTMKIAASRRLEATADPSTASATPPYGRRPVRGDPVGGLRSG